MTLKAWNKERTRNLKGNLTSIFLHPAVLSLLATLLIILILPGKYPKFNIIETNKETHDKPKFNYWANLDDNKYSDFISSGENSIGNTGVTITLYPSQQRQQWNFRGKFGFIYDPPIIVGDFDNNNQSEVYVFTQAGDTILLHCVSNFMDRNPSLNGRFISRVRIEDGKSDPFIVPAQMDDLNEDGFKELMFGIGTGFSESPRRIYGYDIKNDTLYQSETDVYSLLSILQADFNDDGKNEYFPIGYATDNIGDSGIKYHDSSCWFMGLNRQLKFSFEPVEFPGKFGALGLHTIKDKNDKSYILGFYHYPAEKLKPPLLIRFDYNGQIADSISLPEVSQKGSGSIFVIPFEDRNAITFVKSSNCVLIFDETLQIKEILNPGFIPIEQAVYNDLDEDGEEEWIFLNRTSQELVVTKEKFRHVARTPVFIENSKHTTISFKREPGKKPVLFINSGKYEYYFEYLPNPMYYARFGIYAGIYLGLFLFSLIIRKIQRSQLQRRYQAEKKITELQLKIVRNQLDPHFAMNAINSAVAAIQQNNIGKAEQHLYSFSRLYRHLLLTADRITCSLAEELEFTENYIKMEQTRFLELFTFAKSIASDVNMGIEIPKMAIQSYVENAIKHGLRHRASGGTLKIELSVNDSVLIISISDNGIGRTEAGKLGSDSTGKGNQVLEEYFGLFQKITGQKVHSETEDLFDKTGNPAGTCVKIFLTLPQKAQKDEPKKI